jgi:hypothetical protein
MRSVFTLATALSCVALPLSAAPPAWSGYAGNAQHTAAAPAAGAPLTAILWHTPVDLDPQYSGGTSGDLFIHYASPMITANDVVLLPVKTQAASGFEVQARNGAAGGALLWTLSSDYVLPVNAEWTPSFPAGLSLRNTLYAAGAAGTVLYRTNAYATTGTTGRIAFYGNALYKKYATELTEDVAIDTPITGDAEGNIYFGFVVQASNPAKLVSGIARISHTGVGTWVSATSAAADSTISQVAMNCAPAVSADGKTIYIAVSNGGNTASPGYLLGLDSATLATKYKVALLDPVTAKPSWLIDESSASPTVGPDGDVYYGVLENPFPDHADRGWLLHFNSTLSIMKTPGSFGWDDTVSVVPAALVGGYTGTSSYLLMTKYNNYINWADGENRIAILDPNATQTDEYCPSYYCVTPQIVMKEVITQLGPTAAPAGGVYEWCINSSAVDAHTRSVFAGSEDGHFYRWDLKNNTLSQSLMLNAPQGEAYTPSVVGPNGTVYSINNATLYAIGR